MNWRWSDCDRMCKTNTDSFIHNPVVKPVEAVTEMSAGKSHLSTRFRSWQQTPVLWPLMCWTPETASLQPGWPSACIDWTPPWWSGACWVLGRVRTCRQNSRTGNLNIMSQWSSEKTSLDLNKCSPGIKNELIRFQGSKVTGSSCILLMFVSLLK